MPANPFSVLILPIFSAVSFRRLIVGKKSDISGIVIIFKRIKEELRKGAGGWKSAILDASITTAIVCSVLMYFGTGRKKQERLKR